ncbi:MAG: hypothetical protein ACOZAN_02070 [Patescibacteria group bacterium]
MSKKITLLVIGLYLLSRLFVWVFRPLAFTEIIYSYMPYAHLWASGETPYLKHWYEYPPATIPLFFVPHLVDKYTYETPIHLSYLQAYRLQLLLIDFGLFALIWRVLKKYQKISRLQLVSLIYYIFVTSKAHHFIYDTMDLSFVAAITMGLVAPLLIRREGLSKLLSWLGYFLAVALKYINAPLGFVYALLEFDLSKLSFFFAKNKSLIANISSNIKTNCSQLRSVFLTGIKPGLLAMTALLLVWGLPLFYFRSSLQVSLVYHQGRGLQIDSAAGSMVRLINEFSESEKIVERFKNYDIVGPVSQQFLSAIETIFPVSIAFFLLYASFLIFKYRQFSASHKSWLAVYLTILFFLIFMLSGKVLSTPFLLWLLPLLALYPFKDIRQQLSFLLPSALIIVMSMTGWPDTDLFSLIHLHVILINLRWILFSIMLVRWLELADEIKDIRPVTKDLDS